MRLLRGGRRGVVDREALHYGFFFFFFLMRDTYSNFCLQISRCEEKFKSRNVGVGVGDCGIAAWWGAVRCFSNQAENGI